MPESRVDSSDLAIVESWRLPQLRRRLAGIYALCWMLGLGTLLGVAIAEGQERRRQQLDTELQLRATIVYGLAWFDEDGVVHDELLRREPWAHDPEFPIQILGVDEARTGVWGSPLPAEVRGELEVAIDRVVGRAEDSWLGDVSGRRVHLLPMLAEDGPRVRGVAVVSADLSALRREQWGYFGSLLIAFFGLAAGGTVLAWWLSAMSVAPLERLFRSRARFIAAAAHELRTPLSSLRAVAESGRAGDEEALVALARVEAVTTSAARRVDTLLWYARLSAGEQSAKRSPARVDLLLERECEDFGRAVVVAEPTTASVDDALLSVAVANLLSNAERHAGAEGGQGVTVGAHGDHLWVQDEGPGLSPTVLEVDSRRSDHPQGMGVGLAVVQMVARLHGGHVAVRAVTGGGTRIELHWSKI